jgi:hypothetical protein
MHKITSYGEWKIPPKEAFGLLADQ